MDVVEVRLDSEVVVKQMTGTAAVKSGSLREAHWEACELARAKLNRWGQHVII